MSNDDVLFEEISGKNGALGHIILNRASVLNSLNHGMVKAMHSQLNRWRRASNIKAVVIRAKEGRAFCAGGDLRLTYEYIKEKNANINHFFREEYQLNRAIFHLEKPYIAFLDGITMGGGVGISMHGSHRVVTDKLLFAMPETGIGFFPDVGGTYFLPRMRSAMGIYMGLTGARVKSDEAMYLGIATHKVASHAISAILDELTNSSLDNGKQSVSDILSSYAEPQKPISLTEHESYIEQIFSKLTMEEIMSRLEKIATPFCLETLSNLKTKSPTSLKVTLSALQKGSKLDFDQCMQQEFRLACRFLQGHDFPEGIRALIIDKDQKPAWDPATLSEVTEKSINDYFTPLAEELELSVN
jgi:enoyl-CoA hydratase/carnithine racemase